MNNHSPQRLSAMTVKTETNPASSACLEEREEIRVSVAHALAEIGFPFEEMRPCQQELVLNTGEGELRFPVEMLVYVDNQPAILVKCLRGNLNTRERASIAMCRLLLNRTIPFALVANLDELAVLDALTGRTVGHGISFLPDPDLARRKLEQSRDFQLSARQREQEMRILDTYYHLRCAGSCAPF